MFDTPNLLLGFLLGFLSAAAFLSGRLRRARSTLRATEAELALAREQLSRVRQEAQELRQAAEGHTAEVLADNADLRRRMDEVADAILARHGRPADSGG